MIYIKDDFLLCGTRIINFGDFSEFLNLGQPEMRNIFVNGQDFMRLQVKIAKKDYLDYELKSYIQYLQSQEDESELCKKRIELF